MQIQLNYYDWYQGTAKRQYEILKEQGIPVMVMEPVHGGMLAGLPEELSKLEKISRMLRRKIAVPCTGCRYCCDNCPQGLDIPSLLAAYNDYRDEAAASGNSDMAIWRLLRLKALPEEKMPAACIGCGNCTLHCPQALDVPLYMREMASLLEGRKG